MLKIFKKKRKKTTSNIIEQNFPYMPICSNEFIEQVSVLEDKKTARLMELINEAINEWTHECNHNFSL